MNDKQMFFIGRKDGYLYGYPSNNDRVVDWIGDKGTPIKMTIEVAQKLFGEHLIDYDLILAKQEG
jgi:hypothetical protein